MKRLISFILVTLVLAVLAGASAFFYSQYLQSKQLELSRQKAFADCIEKETGSFSGTGYAAALKNSQAKSRCEGYFSN